jgi:hypothetical protein
LIHPFAEEVERGSSYERVIDVKEGRSFGGRSHVPRVAIRASL